MNDHEYPYYQYPADEDVPPVSSGPSFQPYEDPYNFIPPASYGDPVEPISPKKGRKFLALALCFSILGSLLGAGSVLLMQKASSASKSTPQQNEDHMVSYLVQGQREQVILESVTVDTGELMTPAQVYAANVNSTVGITTTQTTSNFWGYQTTSAASGSGFIISQDGYVLTNFHVIEGSDSITVSLFNGKSYAANLIGYDESNDIAVLKINARDLIPVILGDSNNLNVGDTVIAIGNPLGELTFSLTSGSVSAMDREVTFSGNISMKLIQTDCAINSGNSGGALFNLYGEVIGVTNAKYSGSSNSSATIDNIGFAIPINNIRSIVESIITTGHILKPYVGVAVSDLSFQAQFYGYPMGAVVEAVDSNSPAADILQRNDIIIAVGSTQISSSSQFIQFISSAKAGQALTMTVYRNNQYIEVSVTVTETQRSALPNNTQQSFY